jgi:hypothetical protein
MNLLPPNPNPCKARDGLVTLNVSWVSSAHTKVVSDKNMICFIFASMGKTEYVKPGGVYDQSYSCPE